jgi:hypothetical protein
VLVDGVGRADSLGPLGLPAWKRALTVAVTLILTTACAHSPDLVQATIVIAQDTTILVLTPEVGSFRVVAAIANTGSRTIYLGGCGPEAQRKIGTDWQTIWTPICVGAPGVTPIAAGDSVSFPVVVFGFRQPNRLPAFDPRMQTGSYRLLFGLAGDAVGSTTPMAFELRPSTEFIVLDTTAGR